MFREDCQELSAYMPLGSWQLISQNIHRGTLKNADQVVERLLKLDTCRRLSHWKRRLRGTRMTCVWVSLLRLQVRFHLPPDCNRNGNVQKSWSSDERCTAGLLGLVIVVNVNAFVLVKDKGRLQGAVHLAQQ